MSVSYDQFTNEFLSKITEFEFIHLTEDDRVSIVDGFMKRAISEFRKNCKYDLSSTKDDENREFHVDIPDYDLDEITNIVSEGMVVQWLKPYVNRQENLENAISTRDYSLYSPAELLRRIADVYQTTKKSYRQMIRDYSFDHGDLGELHL